MVHNYLLAQTRAVYVGINFGGRYALVAQHCLNDTQVGAPLKQMGGKGVAKGVGAHILCYAHKRNKLLYYAKHHYARQGFLQSLADKDIVLEAAFYGN